MTKVTDTTKIPEKNLIGAAAMGPSKFILAQEGAGQFELVHFSDQLPVDGSEDPRWEELGVTFPDEDVDDPLFRTVILPAGWKKRRTDHSIWSELVDSNTRVVARIFYKAAFYDRRAFMRLEKEEEE